MRWFQPTYSFKQNTSTKPRGSSQRSPIQAPMKGWNRQKYAVATKLANR